jgi:hypothetical protein
VLRRSAAEARFVSYVRGRHAIRADVGEDAICVAIVEVRRVRLIDVSDPGEGQLVREIDGRSNTLSTTLNTITLAPIPSDRVRSVAIVNAGVRASRRTVWRTIGYAVIIARPGEGQGGTSISGRKIAACHNRSTLELVF